MRVNKGRQIKLPSISYVVLYIFLGFVVVILGTISSDNLTALDYLSTFLFLISFILVAARCGEILNVYNLFLLLTYLFHFGQSFIRVIGIEDPYYDRSVLYKTSEHTLAAAELFALMCIFSMTVLYLAKRRRKPSDIGEMSKSSFDEYEYKRIRIIAVILLAITVVPMLYIDLQKIIALQRTGYDSTYQVYQIGIGKYLGLFAQFGKPAVSLLLFSYIHNIKAANKVLFVSTIYLVAIMISGDRGTNFVYLLTNFFIYYKLIKKTRLRTVVLGIFIGYIFLSFMSAISIFRSYDFSMENFIRVLEMRRGDGIFYSALRESGGSMLSLTHSIDYIPANHPFNLGLTYIESLLYISPIVPNLIIELIYTGTSYVHAFPESAADFYSLGGSYLGELYFNFGWVSPIFSAMIGIAIAKIDTAFARCVNVRRMAIIIVLLPSLLLWARDFYQNMVFRTFWMAILILYVRWDFNAKSSNNNK